SGAEPVKRRPLLGATKILLDSVQALDGYKKLVALRVLQLQVFPLDGASQLDVLRIDEAHAREPGDAVVHVDDQLLGLEREAERPLTSGGAAGGPRSNTPQPAEQLCVAVDLDAQPIVAESGRDVQVGPVKAGYRLQIGVQLDLGRRGLDSGLSHQALDPLR